MIAAWSSGQAVPVEVTRTEDGFVLMRGGERYEIKGAGGTDYLKLLAASGANSRGSRSGCPHVRIEFA
ncbi:MAG: hypothetical protein AAFR76_10150, partial [Planctomycetota bacterium]